MKSCVDYKLIALLHFKYFKYYIYLFSFLIDLCSNGIINALILGRFKILVNLIGKYADFM